MDKKQQLEQRLEVIAIVSRAIVVKAHNENRQLTLWEHLELDDYSEEEKRIRRRLKIGLCL